MQHGNYYIKVDLQQQECILSLFWSPGGGAHYHWAKIKVLAGWRSLQKPLSRPFQLLVAGIPWLISASALTSLFFCLCQISLCLLHTMIFVIAFSRVKGTIQGNPPSQYPELNYVCKGPFSF